MSKVNPSRLSRRLFFTGDVAQSEYLQSEADLNAAVFDKRKRDFLLLQEGFTEQ